MVDKETIKDSLEDAWNRWQASCQYAKEQAKPYFFKRFCIYVCLMWNLADAQARFLQQMYIGQGEFASLHEVLHPERNADIAKWATIFAKETLDILLNNDLNMRDELAGFLYGEYTRMLVDTAKPLSLREIAKRELPMPKVDVTKYDE